MFFFIFIGYLVACTLYASVFEWLLHRYVMHNPLFGFTYAFNAHEKVHHRILGSGPTYHLQDEDLHRKNLIKMAWWNGPVLVFIASLPMLIVGMFYGVWWTYFALAGVLSVYFGVYEYLHWCMHLPRPRRLFKIKLVQKIFIRINGHHLLHHRYPKCEKGKNFNVVLPFADWLFGTLLRRAPVPFIQPVGPLVPNVQPRLSMSSLPLDPTLDL